MVTLTTRISAARDIAAEREGDIRIKEFLRALTIWPDASGQDNLTFSISCQFRSWHKHFLPGEAERLRAMSDDALAQTITGWIQGAFANDLLSISNPPVTTASALTHNLEIGGLQQPLACRSVVTYAYHGERLVGRRSG